MIRLALLAALLLLAGCSQIGAQLAIAALSYTASVNNVGAETLRFVDNKEQRACRAQAKPKEDQP